MTWLSSWNPLGGQRGQGRPRKYMDVRWPSLFRARTAHDGHAPESARGSLSTPQLPASNTMPFSLKLRLFAGFSASGVRVTVIPAHVAPGGTA